MESMARFAALTPPAGKKIHGEIVVPGTQTNMAYMIVNGSKPGKTVLMTSGVHGGEYLAIETLIRLYRCIDPSDITGRLILLPLCNPTAFTARRQYVNPVDGKNLNRMFPGAADGTDSQRIAAFISGELFSIADYYMDLHGGDIHEDLIPMTVYPACEGLGVSEKSFQMACQSGFPYLVPVWSDGISICEAAKMAVPSILIEFGGCGRWNDSQANLYLSGVKNILRHLQVLCGEGMDLSAQVQIRSGMYSVQAQHSGCWYPAVQSGQQVEKGDLTGEIRDCFGSCLSKYYAERDGVMGYIVTSLAIAAGEPIFSII